MRPLSPHDAPGAGLALHSGFLWMLRWPSSPHWLSNSSIHHARQLPAPLLHPVAPLLLHLPPTSTHADVTRRASQLLLAHRGLLTPPQLARLAAKVAEVGMTQELRDLVDSSSAYGSHAGQAVGFVAAALTGVRGGGGQGPGGGAGARAQQQGPAAWGEGRVRRRPSMHGMGHAWLLSLVLCGVEWHVGRGL